MNPLLLKGLAIALLVAGLIGIGYHLGDKRATEKLLPQLEQLKAEISASDQQAKQRIKQYEENANAIEQDIVVRESAVRNYYRMLLTKRQAGSGTATGNPIGANEAAIEQGAGGQSFELACALDANKVMMFQEWAVKNGIPVMRK